MAAWLKKIDARAKILGVFAALSVVTTAWSLRPQALTLLCILPLFLVLCCGGFIRALLVRFSFVIGFILLTAVFTFVFPYGDIQEASVRAHRFWFLLLTTVFSVSSLYLLLVTTSTVSVADGLLRLRIPGNVVWTAVLGLRYLPLLAEEGTRFRQAAARGFQNGPRRLRTIGWMIAALFLGTFNRAVRTGQAMESRGYGAGPARRAPRPLTLRDLAFLIGYPGAALTIRVLG